jgi:prepilin peptidase CpaA
MTCHALLLFAPLLVMLGIAAAIDLRQRRIPNWLTLCILLTGLMQSLTAYGTVGPLGSMAGVLCGFGLGAALLTLGALGGGDLKLLAASAAWLGPFLILQALLGAALVGMLLVLVQCACHRRLKVLVHNSVLVAVNLAHVRELGLNHTSATGAACRSVERPLPYAVPLLIAILLILASGRGVI